MSLEQKYFAVFFPNYHTRVYAILDWGKNPNFKGPIGLDT